MFTKSETRRISREFADAIVQALKAFPSLLRATDTDKAAEIVAGIIKAQLTTPAPQPETPDPADALALVMQRISQMPPSA